MVAGGRQVPFPFEITYDPSSITANATVVVRATITVAGRLLFATTAAHRVITGGYPSDGVNVVLQPSEMRVTVTAMLSVAVPLTSVQQKLGEATGTADEKGNWRVVLAFENQTLIKSKDAQVVLEAVATNPLTNQKSEKVRLVVKSR
jgi:hypothetical protein